MTKEESRKAALIAYDALEEKKSLDIQVIEIGGISTLADYFVIGSGTNPNQMQALTDNVEEKLAKAGYTAGHVEGFQRAGWILLDYGDVVIHIFDQESRSFYNLERIWKDGSVIKASKDEK
ncbi:MAG: ribosome silencing factor [Lachnospiraceae bacterium]|nr:ribosome silencing factor [Lachnospiraceae bacterium]MCI1726708.1 ribosome silencing factor [Lachnospiraceae bacterium]